MPQFQHVEKADLVIGRLDATELQDYIVSLEPYYGNPDMGALALVLDADETPRDETRKLRGAFKVLQARNQQMYPSDGMTIKRRGNKLFASIAHDPPPKVTRPRKNSRAAVTA